MSSEGDWPAGVDPVGLEDLGRLGIDRRDRLFWDGRPVEIRRAFVLTGAQRLAATIVTVFAVLGGLGGFFSGLNSAAVYLCARDIGWLGCPRPVAGAPLPPAPPR